MDDTDMFLVNTREAMYFFHSWRETRILRAIRKIGLYIFLSKKITFLVVPVVAVPG